MDYQVYDAIVRMAQANGIDPAYALAIASRESDFDVHGGSGSRFSTAYGLFQLLRSERAKYGGSSSDPYEQANAWGQYIQPTRDRMAQILGREPTGSELYLGHYFNPSRAARMVTGQIPPQTPVQDVFSWKELAANPNIVRAGTVGRLTSSIQSDINRRAARYGGNPDFSPSAAQNGRGPDLSAYGEEVPGQDNLNRPVQGEDLARFGEEVPGQEQVAQATPAQTAPPAPPQTTRQWNIPNIPFGMGGMVTGQLRNGGVNLPPALEQKINNGEPISEDDLKGLPQGDLDKASTMLQSYTGKPLYTDVPVPQTQVADAAPPPIKPPQQPASDVYESPPVPPNTPGLADNTMLPSSGPDLSSFGTQVGSGVVSGTGSGPNFGSMLGSIMSSANQQQQGPQFTRPPDYTAQARQLAMMLARQSPWSVPSVPGGNAQPNQLQQQQPEPLEEFEPV